MSTFDEAIQTVLETENSNFPEVTYIDTGFDYSDSHIFSVMIAVDKEEHIEAGQCVYQCIKQVAYITVIRIVGKDSPETARKECEATSHKIFNALAKNITLSGFLTTGRILENEPGEDFAGSKVKLQVISMEGKYSRRVS
jgi:hypothetical protein